MAENLFLGAVGLQAGGQVGAGISSFIAAQRNARVLREQGRAALEQGRRRARAVLGDIRAGFGAAGVFGVTPTAVAIDAATQLELLALREKWQFRMAAFEQKGAGIDALIGGLVGGAGTALGGAFQASQLFGDQIVQTPPGTTPQSIPVTPYTGPMRIPAVEVPDITNVSTRGVL